MTKMVPDKANLFVENTNQLDILWRTNNTKPLFPPTDRTIYIYLHRSIATSGETLRLLHFAQQARQDLLLPQGRFLPSSGVVWTRLVCEMVRKRGESIPQTAGQSSPTGLSVDSVEHHRDN